MQSNGGKSTEEQQYSNSLIMQFTETTDPFYIRPLLSIDRAWAADLVSLYFGSPCVVSRGILHESGLMPGLVAEREGKRVGLLQYNIKEKQCEVVTLIAVRRRRGIGHRLVKALFPIAHAADCERLWAVTTINNRPAREFFQSLGWQQVAVRRRLSPVWWEFPKNDATSEFEIEYELLFDETGVKYLW